MATNDSALDVRKQEIAETEGGERTRETRVYVPRADIFETEKEVVLLADMPGVDSASIDITLEKNVLTLNGNVPVEKPEDYCLSYAEYGVGDYQRSFVLSNEIDREHIEASVHDGVLRLVLPKLQSAQARKISVKSVG